MAAEIFEKLDMLDDGPEPVGPSKFVIASDGEHDVLLWHVGKAAHSMVNAYGRSCEELSLSGLVDSEGVWVVEGTWHTWHGYEGDYDIEFKGKVREPTQDEWQQIMKGCCPWQEEYAVVAPEAER